MEADGYFLVARDPGARGHEGEGDHGLAYRARKPRMAALRGPALDAAVRLRSASTHWLRHTHGTLALKAEIPLTTARDSLGHASLSTSGIYLHEDLIERKRQMERLFADPAGNPKSASAPAS